MNTTALLIYDDEERFRSGLEDLKQYLDSVGCHTKLHKLDRKSKKTLRAIKDAIKLLEPNQLFLLIYNGHGSPHGWSKTCNYKDLIKPLKLVTGELIVINDTCHGKLLLEHLQKIRESDNTRFIAPWDSEGESYGGTIFDAVKFWPKGVTTEDVISGVTFSTLEGDTEYPAQQVWGASLERRFINKERLYKLSRKC